MSSGMQGISGGMAGMGGMSGAPSNFNFSFPNSSSQTSQTSSRQ